MPEYNSAVSEGLQSRVDRVREEHSTYLTDEIWSRVDDHVDRIEGYNRGNTSSAYTNARKGSRPDSIKLRLQNTAQFRLICHEYGHALMDAHGVDATQEATNRANNKSNYDRWPQFSFGKKDSPVERFLLRRYGDLPDIPRRRFNDAQDTVGRSDIFKVEGSWWEADTYGWASGCHENKRYRDPITYRADGYPESIKLTLLDGHTSKEIDQGQGEIVDRFRLTPGLAEILDADVQVEWSGLERVIRQVNTHWYDAVTLVRKRGDDRTRGQKKAPKGTQSSYYLMNTHEYFAELHAILMNNAVHGKYETHIQRLRNRCPGLVEAYEDIMMDGYPLTV